MRRPGLTLLLVGAWACEPSPPLPEPDAPATPVLAQGRTPTPFSTTTLVGVAAEDTVVRLYVDEACAGPVLRQVTAAELGSGVQLELVPRADNVFTARAWDARGRRSACSEPVRVRFEPAPPPPRPTVEVTPRSPSTQTRYHVKGEAPGAAVVRLFEDACGSSARWELSRADFEERGFFVQVRPNVYRAHFVASVSETGVSSQCTTVPALLCDTLPPPAPRTRLASPTPTTDGWAWVVTELADSSARWVEVFRGPHCTGQLAGWSSLDEFAPARARALVWGQFDEGVSWWSVRLTDEVGNATCVDGEEPVVVDVAAPEPAPVLSVEPFSRIVPSIPVNALRLQFFADDHCGVRTNGYAVDEALKTDLLFVPGTYTARAEVRYFPSDRWWVSRCSNAVIVPGQ